MRIWMGWAIVGTLAMSYPATAQDWCGFRDREHAQVRCGYSSLQQCRQALDREKDAAGKLPGKPGTRPGGEAAICLPDPASG
jgi:hypothetical protein